MTASKRVLIMAAGTGGHIIPALTVARALRQEGIRVEWLGTPEGLEQTLVASEFKIHAIAAQGIRGKNVLTMAKASINMAKAVLQARRLLKQFQPDCVLGFGGYVCLAGGLAAKLSGIPLIIHEQNAVAGMTNRLLAKIATQTCAAFPGSFKKAVVTGNPVRPEIAAIAPLQAQAYTLPLKILIMGGSQGAKVLNEKLPELLAKFSESEVAIWHIAGKKNLEATQANYQKLDRKARVDPFVTEMDEAYRWADLVIARSGALTVSEIAAAGRPAIFIPYPYAVDDHQFVNANYLAAAGAAIVMRQREFGEEAFLTQLKTWLAKPETLAEMGQKAKKLAHLEAAERITLMVKNVA